MTMPSISRFSAFSTVSTVRALSAIALLASLGLLGCGDDGSETGSGGAGGDGATTASGSSTSLASTGSVASTATGAGGDPDASSSGGGTSDGGAGGGEGGSGGSGGELPALEPGLAILDMAMPIDLTSDGRTALIQDPTVIEADVYFYDVADDELVFATAMGDALADFATGLSDNRVISGLHDVDVQAGIWSEETDWVDIESPFDAGCDINVGGAWDVSRDGSVVTGFLWNECSPQAFLYTTADEELTLLDVLGEPFDGEDRPPTNRATVISDDGRVAAGFAENGILDRSAAVWTDDGTGFLLDADGQDAPSEVLSISADGSVLAGNFGYDGFRWTEDDGLVILPRLETALPNDPVFPNAIARDGDLVFGGSGSTFFGVPVAFVWSAEAGTRALQDIVVAAGIEVPEGFLFGNVIAASADGTVLIGTGMDVDFMNKSFVVRLPADAFDTE
jgi:hypothetical protein